GAATTIRLVTGPLWLIASDYCLVSAHYVLDERTPVESRGEPCGNFPGFRHQGASFRAPGAAHSSAHAICSELGPVNFCFKWRHRDGSTIEFSANGWSSDDPAKADWLSK